MREEKPQCAVANCKSVAEKPPALCVLFGAGRGNVIVCAAATAERFVTLTWRPFIWMKQDAFIEARKDNAH